MALGGVRTTRSCVRAATFIVRSKHGSDPSTSDYIDSNTSTIEAFDFDLVRSSHDASHDPLQG